MFWARSNLQMKVWQNACSFERDLSVRRKDVGIQISLLSPLSFSARLMIFSTSVEKLYLYTERNQTYSTLLCWSEGRQGWLTIQGEENPLGELFLPPHFVLLTSVEVHIGHFQGQKGFPSYPEKRGTKR